MSPDSLAIPSSSLSLSHALVLQLPQTPFSSCVVILMPSITITYCQHNSQISIASSHFSPTRSPLHLASPEAPYTQNKMNPSLPSSCFVLPPHLPSWGSLSVKEIVHLAGQLKRSGHQPEFFSLSSTAAKKSY